MEADAIAAAELTAYYSQIYIELVVNSASRPDTVVNYPFNEGKPSALPVFSYSNEVPSVTTSCETKISCDLHYELDWNFRLRTEQTCE